MKARFMILGLSMCGCAMAQESSENAVRDLSEAEMIYGGCAFTRHCLRNYVSTNEPTVSAYGFGRLRFGQPGEFDLQKGEKEAWQILAPGEKPISSPMWGFEEDGSLLPCYMRYLCPATNDVDFAFLGKKIDRIRYGLGVTWLSRRTVSINAFVRFDEPEFTQADAEKVVVAVAEMPEIRPLGRMERQPLKCEPKVAKRTRLGKGKPRDEDNVRPRRAYACLAMSNESYKVEITSGVDGGGGSSPEPISVELSVGGKPHLHPYMNIQVVDFRIGRVAFQEEKATLKLMKEFSMPSTLGVDLSPIERAISPEAKKAEQLERFKGLLNQKTANRPDRACQNPGFRQK